MINPNEIESRSITFLKNPEEECSFGVFCNTDLRSVFPPLSWKNLRPGGRSYMINSTEIESSSTTFLKNPEEECSFGVFCNTDLRSVFPPLSWKNLRPGGRSYMINSRNP